MVSCQLFTEILQAIIENQKTDKPCLKCIWCTRVYSDIPSGNNNLDVQHISHDALKAIIVKKDMDLN